MSMAFSDSSDRRQKTEEAADAKFRAEIAEAERVALAAENERLRAAARDYLAVTNHVVGPRYVVDARKALSRLAGAAGGAGAEGE